MKIRFKPLLAAILLVLTPRLPAASFDELLPAKGTEGRLMAMGVTDRIKEITDKMTEAIRKNQEWFIEATKKAPPGAPMPYDGPARPKSMGRTLIGT